MDWNTIYSTQRTGQSLSTSIDARTEFQRDFDRIIFSTSFRRLQNKTQVFPLPKNILVHNRLTHSLEVASVGRTLGALIGQHIAEKFTKHLTDDAKAFYQHSLYNVIAAACLCHDIGNPAFGHSGEDAIAHFFIENERHLKSYFNDEQWFDFIHFEGNANAMRLLTHQQNGKDEGGLKLTHTTLASIAKYPCEAKGKQKGILHRKKFGFLQSQKEIFKDIALSTNMIMENDNPLIYKRHPFVWLVEIADDICYNIIDVEDAHRLGIISFDTCKTLFTDIIHALNPESNYNKKLNTISDKNETIAFLRALCINYLIKAAVKCYEENIDAILDGSLNKSIINIIKEKCIALDTIEKFSIENIYGYKAVVEIENAGYNVMYELLQHFIPPILKIKSDRSNADKKALQLVAPQFIYDNNNTYENVLGIIDFVSGMTDNYATDLYRKIKGIEIGMSF
ncbi:MAG: dNTP triphosphohydrolase [Chitinophagales bacterium]|nr:dNTP triphosphohydrolase [Chitinophagales bacterium]